MKRTLPWLGTLMVGALAALAGVSTWRYVPLTAWTPALPGLLTALSLLSGAVLVRLARNSPITSPSTFNDDDLERFFDTLEKLSSRLFWIFIQTILAITLVLGAFVLGNSSHPEFTGYEPVSRCLSALLAFIILWLMWRLVLMARGDIGFLRLQRIIIQNALRRDKRKEAGKIVNSPVTLKSPGKFGGLSS